MIYLKENESSIVDPSLRGGSVAERQRRHGRKRRRRGRRSQRGQLAGHAACGAPALPRQPPLHPSIDPMKSSV